MSDVRNNIREMLDAVRVERKQIGERDKLLAEREDKLIEWLAEEQPKQTSFISGNGSTPLVTFLQTVIADGKPHSTEELAMSANTQGLIGAKKSPRRVVNMAMQGLYKIHLVRRNSDKDWIMK